MPQKRLRDRCRTDGAATFVAVLLLGVTACSLEPERPASQVKPVLILVAPVDFYYQEYADPRRALEEAGLEVVVASRTAAAATPHAGSWEGDAPADPTVLPDLTLDSARAEDYSALVISGGWGATTYFYAFDGDLINDVYDPHPQAKVLANALIGDFLAQGKRVLGVCNGVNVLSWARLAATGLSPLDGRTVSAPHQPVPSMVFDGVTYTYTSATVGDLWMHEFASLNGANVVAENAVGDPGSDRDDVSVDGLILTAQNNFAAYAAGQALAAALKR